MHFKWDGTKSAANAAKHGVSFAEASTVPKHEDDPRPEYDFTGGVRGKYLERYREGTSVIRLEPDVAAVFQDSAAVNEALRRLVSLAEAKSRARRPAPRRRSKPNKTLQPTSSAPGGLRRSGRAARG